MRAAQTVDERIEIVTGETVVVNTRPWRTASATWPASGIWERSMRTGKRN